MRWSGQALDADDGALPGLERAGLVRSVQTPEFEGITFHEVLCKSALNKMPEESTLPFSFTVNAFRGCSHACRYCFARPSHEYLDLDAGADFDSQVVVKTNIAAVLRKELARKSWKREAV
ncbi:MAG: radical SAM protein, partial [Rhodococcus sp. (in: high G+C Gram-positive bacteria)]